MRKIDFRLLGLCAIGFIFSGLIGFMIAGANNVTFDGHKHNTDHLDTAYHGGKTSHSETHAEPITIPKNGLEPSIRAELQIDPVSGFNLHLITGNFTFAPESAGLKHKDGIGHAHLYIDEHKIARLYNSWFHIDTIPEDAKQMRITLYSNDHRPFMVDNKIISAVIELNAKP